MTRIMTIVAIVAAFALGAVSQRSAKGLNVNSRWIMRGARCTNEIWQVKDFGKEGQFQEVATVTVSKTINEGAWMVKFTDYYGCSLGFWAESGEPDKPITVKNLSSY